MSETNIFSGDPANEVVPPAIPSATIPPDVSEFVGEGKKYKSIEDALKSVPNAQRHITQIEEENARLKAEVASRQSVEEIFIEIKSGIKPIETQAGAVLDPNVIADIVFKQIQLFEKQKLPFRYFL